MDKKKCNYCKKEFTFKHGNKGYCSDPCEDIARKLRGYKRYNSIKNLTPTMLDNHKLLNSLFERKLFDLTVLFLENEGLDFSIFRRLYPEPGNSQYIRLDFGTYYLETKDDFLTFKLYKYETTTSETE